MCPFWHVFFYYYLFCLFVFVFAFVFVFVFFVCFCFYFLTLAPKAHFVQFYLNVASYLLSGGKICDSEAVMKNKIEIDLHEIGTFSIITSKVKWIWSWNFGIRLFEKNIHLTHQNTNSGQALGDVKLSLQRQLEATVIQQRKMRRQNIINYN